MTRSDITSPKHKNDQKKSIVLNVGETIPLHDGKKITILPNIQKKDRPKIIGEGAQGTIYEVVDEGGENYAFKWFTERSANNKELLKNIKEMCMEQAPSSAFVWPIDYCENKDGFGYLMKLIDTGRYNRLKTLLYKKVDYGLPLEYVTLEILDAFEKLHNTGKFFCDINDDDIFYAIDDDSEVRIQICDCDNISDGSTKSDIFGREGYVAPELIMGNGEHSIESDLYSLSVIMFKLFVRNHPLEGKLFKEKQGKDEKNKMYGEEALFIFDENDSSNSLETNRTSREYWYKLPNYIRNLFVTSFEDGLFEPSDRPTTTEWINAFNTMIRDGIRTGEMKPIEKKIQYIFFMVDTSASMNGKRIETINDLLSTIGQDLKMTIPMNIQIMTNIMTFDDKANWIFSSPVEIDKMVNISLSTKKWSNSRVDLAIDLLNMALKKKNARSNGVLEGEIVTPVVVILSNGDPTVYIDGAMKKIIENRTFLSALRFGFIPDDECDEDTLCNFTGIDKFVFKTGDMELFKSLFKYVTIRASQISSLHENEWNVPKRLPSEDMQPPKPRRSREWGRYIPGAYTSEHSELERNIDSGGIKNPYYSGWR